MLFQDEEKIIREVLSGKRIFGISKEKHFSLWFKVVLRAADIVEDRFPTKGLYMYPWYGLDFIKRVIRHLEELLEETGHREERYPSLVPLSVFMKEKDFFEGFQGEAYLITETLRKERLDEPLVVRPTSETIMYPLWAKRINSYKQLPIKIYQTVNVFRLETKMTKPLLRLREVAFFNEAHTAHRNLEDAERQVKEALNVYMRFYDDLAIPYFVIKTPSWDTFPGALYNYDLITVLPDGKCLELGSVINLGQKFSRVFNIKFVDEKGRWEYVYQTCYGISERAAGALIAIHGDDRGLVLLPEYAPIQIVIVPIFYSDEQREIVMKKCIDIKKGLEKEYRVYFDDSMERTPGYKFHYWEMKGVPLRIEIGPRDVEKKEITLFRRDLNVKEKVAEDSLFRKIREVFSEFRENLRKRANEYFKEKVIIARDIDDLKKYVKGRPVIIPFCGKEECASFIETNFETEVLGFIENFNKKLPKTCIMCDDDAKHWALVGKTY